jgi:hypothetical protein
LLRFYTRPFFHTLSGSGTSRKKWNFQKCTFLWKFYGSYFMPFSCHLCAIRLPPVCPSVGNRRLGATWSGTPSGTHLPAAATAARSKPASAIKKSSLRPSAIKKSSIASFQHSGNWMATKWHKITSKKLPQKCGRILLEVAPLTQAHATRRIAHRHHRFFTHASPPKSQYPPAAVAQIWSYPPCFCAARPSTSNTQRSTPPPLRNRP